MADIAASDVTITVNQNTIVKAGRDRIVRGSLSFGNGTLTYDQAGNGIPLDKGRLGGFNEIKDFIIKKVDTGEDLRINFDKDSQSLRLYSGLKADGMSTLTIKDDDCAASTGVALYIHKPEALPANGESRYITHLECATANNADATLRLGANGPSLIVEDNDSAATGNAALFLDENDNRLMADLDAGDHDVYLQLSDGSLLRIYDVDDPGCSGVQVYFDDDAANDYERALAVTAGNADDTVSQELANDEPVAPVSLEFTAVVA